MHRADKLAEELAVDKRYGVLIEPGLVQIVAWLGITEELLSLRHRRPSVALPEPRPFSLPLFTQVLEIAFSEVPLRDIFGSPRPDRLPSTWPCRRGGHLNMAVLVPVLAAYRMVLGQARHSR